MFNLFSFLKSINLKKSPYVEQFNLFGGVDHLRNDLYTGQGKTSADGKTLILEEVKPGVRRWVNKERDAGKIQSEIKPRKGYKPVQLKPHAEEWLSRQDIPGIKITENLKILLNRMGDINKPFAGSRDTNYRNLNAELVKYGKCLTIGEDNILKSTEIQSRENLRYAQFRFQDIKFKYHSTFLNYDNLPENIPERKEFDRMMHLMFSGGNSVRFLKEFMGSKRYQMEKPYLKNGSTQRFALLEYLMDNWSNSGELTDMMNSIPGLNPGGNKRGRH